ncbi:peroxidase 55-like isoform X2 [Papaver somniferum]|uniref:peroxidase 55-like isoform X2 n=1 Tax=Papaver somniferum TaxID=3469 RepID=UPI000E6FBA9D|nr:peroxidase 55-like isoform X2 [Papaver somniferum]
MIVMFSMVLLVTSFTTVPVLVVSSVFVAVGVLSFLLVGCDGSVLILPTDDNNSERNASINLSLAGDAFDIVDKAKAALEKECPGVVSCPDILAILARDVVHWWEGPHWEVEKGRRDGLISNATEAQLLMPKSDENITTLIRGFESIGLSTADLVTLSGAHTIGFTHCIEFASRIFHNDTTLNSTIREKVILSCPFPKIDRNVAEALDQTSEFVFDNKFYKSLRQRKGLLLTDHVLAFG